MLTGTALINELVDELNELKLSTMAATLDDLYHKPGFLEMGYDWTAESLEDIELEIDYANARISVIVGGWEMSWAYSIEI